MITKKLALYTTLFIVAYGLKAQQEEQSAADFQKELDRQYSTYESSPLEDGGKGFTGHDFFPITDAFRIEARFIRILDPLPFNMETTGDAEWDSIYGKYGEAHFDLNGKECVPDLYQSPRLSKTEENKSFLFLPFTDLTNGKETYIIGRYIDLEIPVGDTVMIDSNKACNPYCAYNKKYSREIPPKWNHLEVAVLAGVKKPKK